MKRNNIIAIVFLAFVMSFLYTLIKLNTDDKNVLTIKHNVIIRPTPTPIPTTIPTPKPVAFKITPKKSNLHLTKKFTTTSSGNRYGLGIPPIYEELWMVSTDKFVGFAGLEENLGFRTNVAVLWRGGNASFNMTCTDPNGSIIGTITDNTNKYINNGAGDGFHQYDRLIRTLNSNYTGIYSCLIHYTGGTGSLFFYATTIDNTSGDASYFTHQRYAADNTVWSQSGQLN